MTAAPPEIDLERAAKPHGGAQAEAAVEHQSQSRSSSSSSESERTSVRTRDDEGEGGEEEAEDFEQHVESNFEALAHALTPDLETPSEHAAREPISHVRTTTSIGSAASRPPDYEVGFDADDPENPKTWPLWYRGWITFCLSFSTWVVVLYSTSYTSSIVGMMEEFHVPSQTVATLGVTTYLVGLAVGSLIVAPMSELYGRRPLYIACLVVFSLLVLPCALAKSLSAIIIVRFFGATFGAVMVSNSPGTIVDISEPEFLGLYMSFWSIAPLNGPVTGPLIGGFVFQGLGWRWDNWIVLILGGVAICLMCTVKETYAPALLQKKAARIRKETGDDRWWCQYEQKVSTWHLIRINLSRPFILLATEPILWFFDIWISIIYGILYLCFVAYPIIFTQHRGWGPGITGLAFIGIGIGTMITICAEPLLRGWINRSPKDPETGRALPEATAKVMTLGAFLTPIGQLAFSWTSLPTRIHWAVPIFFGIPFGMGNTMSFIYGSNYLAGAYGMYAASALAGNAVLRSMFGGTLPLAGPAMYRALTPQWAGTFLGLLEVCLIPIPFVFQRYGARIRAKSPVIRQMREEQLKADKRRRKQAAKSAKGEGTRAGDVDSEALRKEDGGDLEKESGGLAQGTDPKPESEPVTIGEDKETAGGVSR